MIKPYAATPGPDRMGWILGPKAAEDPTLREAARKWRRDGKTLDVRLTWESGDGSRWARELADADCSVLVAAGGDGTLHEVINGLRQADPKPAVGLLPFGTANDFAQSAGILAGRPADALDHIIGGRPKALDLIEVQELATEEERLTVNMVTTGWGTQSTAGAAPESKRWLGAGAYFLEGLTRLSELETQRVEIVGPHFAWRGKVLALAVGNGRFAGGGLMLCPKALLDDGLLDLMILPAQDLTQWLPRLGEALLQGNAQDLTPLVYRRLPWLEVRFSTRQTVHLDGEPLEGRKFRFKALEKHQPFFLGSDERLTPPEAP